MLFHYIASQKDGKIVESEMQAESLDDVLKFLTSRGMKPISVRAKEKGGRKGISLFGGKITMDDQMFIFRYLSLMLKIGANLLSAINILIEDFDKEAVRSFLMEVRANLERGTPFYLTFANYPRTFSSVHINLIKAGEVSGGLEAVFENISESLTKEKSLRDQMKNALVYPVLLLGISAFILVFLVTFALPRIAGVFIDSGFEPPIFSKIVFSVGLFFGKVWFLVIGGFVGAIIAIFFLYRNSLIFKKFVWVVLTEVPVIKEIIKKRALQRFAATSSSLIKAGIPINEALEITADAAGNYELKNALLRISREGLAKGLMLGDAFKKEPFFPRTVVSLIAISEKAGHVEEVLETLSDFYIAEVNTSLKRLVTLLEPILLLGIGIIIGTIALAIIIPIYQLTTQF